MTIPSTMRALLLRNDGYADKPSGTVLEAMEPYVEAGTIEVPRPEGRQVLIKVSLASINPSDVMFVKGMYGQPRAKGRPAGWSGSRSRRTASGRRAVSGSASMPRGWTDARGHVVDVTW